MTARTFTPKADGPGNLLNAADWNAFQAAFTALSQIRAQGSFVQGTDATGTEGETVIGTVGALLYAASTGLMTWSDVSKLIWDAANGRLGIGQATPTAGLHLPAGVAGASGAPLKMASGTLLTAAEAGAVEFDGKAFYATAVAAQRQFVDSALITVQAADFTGTNVNTAQPVFAATQDVITLAASTTYLMEAVYHIHTTGTTSHTLSLLFAIGGSLTNIDYSYWVTNTATEVVGAVSAGWASVATATVVTAALASATHHTVLIKGVVRTNAAGTFTPQYQWSAAPGVASVTLRGSYLRLTPIGSDVVAVVGGWA